MQEIELTKPVQHEGQTIETVSLDLDGLTGEDMVQAENEYMAMGGGAGSGVAELSKAYLVHVAARACGLPVEAIKAMSMRDVTRITMETQNHLLG